MTPDMKRLCDAVWSAEATPTFREATGERSSDDATSHERGRYQAIVRSVLMALREPSDEATSHASYVAETLYQDNARWLPALIDHILAEPATP
ncbi:hypothetical protein MKK88_01020 [Methylobacterium sp. E-005]|uniref:hypothetical protein n=1 Tax=Methylobacterium sp. E-005 TaxID=2836549 RepID=UPI001FB943F9|nr:hypothetical protein [Methylobacterium sp. E-005]MCJ2084577.1 hypothetical protein [Methylobacterium sp. E-005]